MSIKLSTAQQLQNLKEQIKNLDKSLVEETKKFRTSMSDLVDKGIIDQLNVDLPFNSTTGEVINGIVLSKIEYSSGNNLGFPKEFDTAEFRWFDGAKTGVLPKQNDGEILIIDNSDHENFIIPSNDFSEYSYPEVARENFVRTYKNRFVLIWGSGSISRKEIRNAIIKSKYFRTKSWVICDYKKPDGNIFEYKDVLKKLQKYYPVGWIFSSIGIGNGCAPALKNLGDINYDFTEDSNVKNYTGYFFDSSTSNIAKRLSGDLYKKNILPTVGFIFPTFPEGDTWADNINTSTYIPDNSEKRNLIIRTNTKEMNNSTYNNRFKRINNIYNPDPKSSITDTENLSINYVTSPTDPYLLAYQAWKESRWDPSVESGAEAVGVSQIRYIAAEEYQKHTGINILSKSARRNIPNSFDFQKWYMKYLYDKPFVQNPPGLPEEKVLSFRVKIARTLGAYNNGPDNFQRNIEKMRKGGIDVYSNLDWVKKYPVKETRNYINVILGLELTTESTGLSDVKPWEWRVDSNNKKYKFYFISDLQELKNYKEHYIYALQGKNQYGKPASGVQLSNFNQVKKVFFSGITPAQQPPQIVNSIPSSSPSSSESTESSEKAITFKRLRYTGREVKTRFCVQDLQNVEYGDGTIITQFIDDHYMEF